MLKDLASNYSFTLLAQGEIPVSTNEGSGRVYLGRISTHNASTLVLGIAVDGRLDPLYELGDIDPVTTTRRAIRAFALFERLFPVLPLEAPVAYHVKRLRQCYIAFGDDMDDAKLRALGLELPSDITREIDTIRRDSALQ